MAADQTSYLTSGFHVDKLTGGTKGKKIATDHSSDGFFAGVSVIVADAVGGCHVMAAGWRACQVFPPTSALFLSTTLRVSLMHSSSFSVCLSLTLSFVAGVTAQFWAIAECDPGWEWVRHLSCFFFWGGIELPLAWGCHTEDEQV